MGNEVKIEMHSKIRRKPLCLSVCLYVSLLPVSRSRSPSCYLSLSSSLSLQLSIHWPILSNLFSDLRVHLIFQISAVNKFGMYPYEHTFMGLIEFYTEFDVKLSNHRNTPKYVSKSQQTVCVTHAIIPGIIYDYLITTCLYATRLTELWSQTLHNTRFSLLDFLRWASIPLV